MYQPHAPFRSYLDLPWSLLESPEWIVPLYLSHPSMFALQQRLLIVKSFLSATLSTSFSVLAIVLAHRALVVDDREMTGSKSFRDGGTKISLCTPELYDFWRL